MAHAQHHSHHEASGHDPADLLDLLDLDAEVLHALLSELTGWLRELAADAPVRRILDLGAGTGAGALALLPRFPDARVTAVDLSPKMLRRLRDKAEAQGVSGRVRTVEADLDEAWPQFGEADLVWASASLHHMADPDLALRRMHAALRPGGLLALVEISGFPFFLPDDLGLGRPGLETRARAALAPVQAEGVPHLGADWGPRLSGAGFGVEAERTFSVRLSAPLPEAAGRYAQGMLRRARPALDGRLDADDLAVLDALLADDGPDSVLRRDDLVIRTERTVWAARRPASSDGI